MNPLPDGTIHNSLMLKCHSPFCSKSKWLTGITNSKIRIEKSDPGRGRGLGVGTISSSLSRKLQSPSDPSSERRPRWESQPTPPGGSNGTLAVASCASSHSRSISWAAYFLNLLAPVALVYFAISALALAASAQPAPAQKLSSSRVLIGAEAMPAVEPAFVDIDIRNLAIRRAWSPGDGIKMIPKRFYLSGKLVDSQSRAKAPIAGKVDPLLEAQAEATVGKLEVPPLLNFSGGLFTGAAPPDTVGDVGIQYYIQSTNSSGGSVFSVYDKETGVLVAGPLNMDALSAGSPGIVNCSIGRGDPIVLYDHLASRWLLSEFSDAGNKLCIYISATADPIAGGWFAYEFSAPQFPDYPKYGVWPDAYYIGTNEGSGPGLYALDRTSMLLGQAATMQRFGTSRLNGFGFQILNPSDLDGPTPPPANTPNFFVRHNDDETHNSQANDPLNDFIEIFEFRVDFANSANSSLTGPISVPISDFDSNLCGLSSFSCIPQPNAGIPLDPLREVVMWRVQYRNTSAYESLVGSHVTDVDNTDHAGVRWWELRRNNGGPWSLAQEGTYAPDAHSRWMSSAATDQSGNLALGYSTGSASLSAGIRYNGRLQGDPPGILSLGETVLSLGTGVQSNERWGDYSALVVDPVDDCTFWYTNEYAPANGTWATQIGKFKFDSCGTPGINVSATNLSQKICSPSALKAITVSVTSSGGFTGATALSFPSLPPGFSGSFSATPVTPTAQSTAILTADANAFFNTHQIEILATATGAENKSLLADVKVYSLVPPVPDLQIPGDGSVNVSTLAPFSWTHTYQAENYTLEVDDDPTFSSIDLLASGPGVTHIATTPFQSLTTYYWRVRTSNACGEVLSPVHSFTTAGTNLFCSSPNLPLSSTSPVSDSINITQLEALTDLSVSLDIAHSWVGDVRTTLTHVDTGTSTVLIDRPGFTTATGGFGCSTNDINATLSDLGSGAAENQCSPTAPALMGTLTPNNPLSAFAGESLAGTWTILAEDLAGGDSGTFNQWCLVPTQLPEPTSFILLSTGILFMSGEQALRRRRRRKSAADPR